MPPLSLVHLTPSRTPWAKLLPTSEVTPVRSKMPPTLISPAWAMSAANSIDANMSPPSIREWIQLPIRLDAVPAGRHAVGLEDEEEHDGQAEHAHLQ